MAAFLRKNFARGSLAVQLTALSTQMTLDVGHTLPAGVGSFPVVIWDMTSFPNPVDDPDTEIVIASYSGLPNIYDIQRAQEGTAAVAHAVGDEVALHYTSGMSEDDILYLGQAEVDESDIGNGKLLVVDTGGGSTKLKYTPNLLHNAVTVVDSDSINFTLTEQQITAVVVPGGVDHDQLANFVADEHIAHSGVSILAGTGLTGGGDITTNRTLALSHLGIQSLSDPGADRILFWDESAPDACKWLSCGNSIAITNTTLDTIQDIRTVASPTFAGLTLSDDITFNTSGLRVGRTDSHGIIFNDTSTEVQFQSQYTTYRFTGDTWMSTEWFHYGNTNSGAFMVANKSRGTSALPIVVDADDYLMRWSFRGYSGSAFADGAQINMRVDGTPSASSMPGRIVFLTTPVNSTTPVERMRITNDGNTKILSLDGYIREVTTLPDSAGQNELIALKNTTETALYFGKWSTASIQTDAVAQWRMNDNAEDKVVVENIAGKDGASQRNTNVITVAGKINTALSFDGTNDWIRITDDDVLDVNTGDFAVSFWLKTSTAGTMRLIQKRSIAVPDNNIGWELYIVSGLNYPGVFIGDSSGYTTLTFSSYSGNLRDGAWHHIVINWDRDGNATPYIDGVAYTGVAISARPGSLSNTKDLGFGIFADWASNKFTGVLDDVRLYKRLLTTQEIANLFNQNSGTEGGEKLYWVQLAEV